MNTVAFLLLASSTVVLCKPTTTVTTVTTVKPETTTTVSNSNSQYDDLITAIVSLNEPAIFNELNNYVNLTVDLGKTLLEDLPKEAMQEFQQLGSTMSTPEFQKVLVPFFQIINERQSLEKSNRRTPITRAEAATIIERVFQIQKPEDLPNAVNTFYCAYNKLETEFEPKRKQLINKYPAIKQRVEESKALNDKIIANLFIVFKPVTDAVEPYLTCVNVISESELNAPSGSERTFYSFSSTSGFLMIALAFVW